MKTETLIGKINVGSQNLRHHNSGRKGKTIYHPWIGNNIWLAGRNSSRKAVCNSRYGVEKRKGLSWGRDTTMKGLDLNTIHSYVKTAKNCGAHFRWVQLRCLTTVAKLWRRNCSEARARTTTENGKVNIKAKDLSLPLSPWPFIYLCLAKEVSSFFICCFSLLDDN